jgi:regulator of sigma E protease
MVGHTVATVEAVEMNMPAQKLGLLPGDTLLTVNDTTVTQPSAIIFLHRNAGKNITMAWKRGTDTLSGTTTVTDQGRIGIKVGSHYNGPALHIQYSIFQALYQGTLDVGQSVHLFYLTFSKVFSGKTSIKESLGGPVAIAQIATQSAEMGFITFVWFMAQLSMSLAILNILPIPALDGGHLIMLFYEKIMRREIPYKIKISIQQVGFFLLLAFMAFVIYNDISRF